MSYTCTGSPTIDWHSQDRISNTQALVRSVCSGKVKFSLSHFTKVLPATGRPQYTKYEMLSTTSPRFEIVRYFSSSWVWGLVFRTCHSKKPTYVSWALNLCFRIRKKKKAVCFFFFSNPASRNHRGTEPHLPLRVDIRCGCVLQLSEYSIFTRKRDHKTREVREAPRVLGLTSLTPSPALERGKLTPPDNSVAKDKRYFVSSCLFI